MFKYKILRNLGIIVSIFIIVEILILFPKKNEYVSRIEKDEKSIYLFDDNNYVAKVPIHIYATNQDEIIKEIIKIMTQNQDEKYSLRKGFKGPIPENTKLLNYQLEGDTIILNFSKELLNIEPKMEEKMYEAIIYSLTSIEGINNIIIKVEDEIVTDLKCKDKKLPEILNRDFKINKEYNTFSLENINEITVYYPARKDNFNYYIPVTKYLNNDKEKIEIIIDELKSSSTYNTNLVNYINEETKLINYELTDKSLILNFSETIFTDITGKNIKEEITYAINSSIKDSYNNLTSVIYSLNNNIEDTYFFSLG